MRDLRFPYFVFDWLKENHPFFRYSILTKGDYEPYLHQSEIFYRLLVRHPVRFLIADDVGLGKTVEGIMVIDQLVKLRKVSRILLILPRVLVKQWCSELNKFSREWNLSIRVYSSHEQFEPGIIVTSVDTFKRKKHLNKFLLSSWDLIIVDEIHKISITSGKETQRFRSMSNMIRDTINSHFLGLSATPHKGNDKDYIQRLSLIDPYLKELNDSLVRYAVRAIILKRTKDNVNKAYEESNIFPDAYFIQYLIEPNESEKKYYTIIRELSLSILKDYYDKVNKPPRTLPLLSFIIGRRSLSSPYAGLLTFERMIKNRSIELKKLNSSEVIEEAEEYAESEEIEEEIEPDEIVEKLLSLNANLLSKYEEYISELVKLARDVMQNDSRVNELVKLIDSHLSKGDKVVVFTEYKDTASYLYDKVKNLLKLDDKRIKVVSSDTLNKEGIESVKEWLSEGHEKVLIATDVASEGLNLQSANVLIHYELPLSIVRFEQRNGRIWRLKQSKPVFIYYISLNTQIEQAIIANYYNKLLSITKGTGSITNVADAVIYKAEEPKIFNLSEDKENIPIYLGFGNQGKEEKITPIKVWESALEGKIDEVVNTILRRIKILKESMKKFALYESSSRAIVGEIGKVREIVGFKNRMELKDVLDNLTHKMISNLEGRIDGNSIKVGGRILEYSEDRLGNNINVIYNILRSPQSSRFVICDALEDNVYLVDAMVSLGNIEVLKMPIVVDSKGNIKYLSEFLSDILPLTFTCNKLYPEEVEPIDDINSKSDVISKLVEKIFRLERQFAEYRSYGVSLKVRGKDDWIPNKLEDIKVRLNIVGGILGIKNNTESVSTKVVDALKRNWNVSITDNKIKLEGKGEVRYAEIVKPDEILRRNSDNWRYSLINGVLVGVKHGD